MLQVKSSPLETEHWLSVSEAGIAAAAGRRLSFWLQPQKHAEVYTEKHSGFKAASTVWKCAV